MRLNVIFRGPILRYSSKFILPSNISMLISLILQQLYILRAVSIEQKTPYCRKHKSSIELFCNVGVVISQLCSSNWRILWKHFLRD